MWFVSENSVKGVKPVQRMGECNNSSVSAVENRGFKLSLSYKNEQEGI